MLTDYDILKAYGHSPALAATIVLDARRGDRHSIEWIKRARASVERGAIATDRARQMNAELPADQRDMLALKGMIA